MNEMKIPLWRYIISVILFVAIILFGSYLSILVFTFFNRFFTPRYYQSSKYWCYFIGSLVAAFAATAVIGKMAPNPVFCMVICILGCIYLSFTAIINIIMGYSEFFQFASILGSGILCGVMAFQYGKEIPRKKEE